MNPPSHFWDTTSHESYATWHSMTCYYFQGNRSRRALQTHFALGERRELMREVGFSGILGVGPILRKSWPLLPWSVRARRRAWFLRVSVV